MSTEATATPMRLTQARIGDTAVRRQRHPGGDRQGIHDGESRDRGDGPRRRLPGHRWGTEEFRVYSDDEGDVGAGGASRHWLRRPREGFVRGFLRRPVRRAESVAVNS